MSKCEVKKAGRSGHRAVAFNMSPGATDVVIFGGFRGDCLADTTLVLVFGKGV